MAHPCFPRTGRVAGFALVALSAIVLAPLIPTTLVDFHLPGTQVGDIGPWVIGVSDNCRYCHSDYDAENEPYATWAGSLMGQAGRDPLFFAQMTTANQDVANVGYFCMRCHVPMSFITGHALQPDGSTLDHVDADGITCHFCHSMVDPVYKPGVSPPQDLAILRGLESVPGDYGNAMFVLDPNGTRRGPYSDVAAPHNFIYSPFHRTSEFCGTCHDVGNVAVTRTLDGAFKVSGYTYNVLDQPAPEANLCAQFPLERTYTEWKLSAFARGGVDMGERYPVSPGARIETCQDCHMPTAVAKGCVFGPERSDLRRHDFAGAGASVLDLIAEFTKDDPNVDQAHLRAGKRKSLLMLRKAASLEVRQAGGELLVRIVNETGHKLPTGHIEGRRVWINVRYFDGADRLIGEFGHYDYEHAELDEITTRVYEMHVGLSPEAANLTGLPPGPTTHMALADIIVKDNRIPPRGFSNAAFEDCGGPVVGATYADGQYWDDVAYPIVRGATRAEVTAYYQNLPRHYIEALRDGNHTDDWGQVLYDLWEKTGKGAPIPMVSASLPIHPLGAHPPDVGLRPGRTRP